MILIPTTPIKGCPGTLDCIYRACMSLSAPDQDAEAQRAEALRKDELALVHEVFAEEHESAAESLSGDLAEAHRGAADKHLEAADEDRSQAQTAREEADADNQSEEDGLSETDSVHDGLDLGRSII